MQVLLLPHLQQPLVLRLLGVLLLTAASLAGLHLR
jgi:hypothetical protein